MTFNEFYHNIYLPNHSKWLTQFIHCQAINIMLICIAMASWVSWWLIPLGIFVNLVMAISSHILVEKNSPVFTTSPTYLLWAVASEFRLWWEYRG